MSDASPAHDHALIRDLVGRAAHLADEGTPDDYRTLYTHDATWTFGASTQNGIEEIVAATRQRRAEGVSGPGTATRHLVVPLHVTVDGDTADAVSYFLFFGDTTSAPVVRVFGVYADELTRTPGGWRIYRRVSRVG
ncbi:nuclear transport factor 2 family protein [Streptosporangium amethystogenes]|uniref:nuclear transport factor 2 family protein n=1 Tax=Streptosporangium amethystogenes TaxID=2002 RepID=UPI00068ECF21|nr:nuclear transport factor 2 family protein [Streptosporangium amethystogenes]